MDEYISKKNLREVGIKQVLDWLPLQTDYGRDQKEGMQVYGISQVEDLRRSYREMALFRKALRSSDSHLWNLKGFLSEIKDLRGSLKRVHLGEVLNEVEIFEIKHQVMVMEELRDFFLRNSELALEKFQMASVAPLIKTLDPEGAKVKTFYIYDSYSNELYNLREEKRKIDASIQSGQKSRRVEVEEEMGIKPKLNNEVLIPKDRKDLVEKAEASRKIHFISETFRSYVFKILPTKEQKALKERLYEIRRKEEEEEYQIRKMLSAQIRGFYDEILLNIRIVGELDLTIGKILLGEDMKGVEPRIVDYPYIGFQGGRHSVLEQRLLQEGKKYMPVDLTLEEGVTLITGANMGGKTLTLKLIALIAGLAQLGLYVPAEEVSVGPFSFIYFSSGDGQSEEKGLSTFGSEIYYLKNLTESNPKQGLILLDELGRGTNPEEGYGLSYGIIEYFKKVSGITVITTHLDGLTEITGTRHLRVTGLKYCEKEQIQRILKESMDGRSRLEDLMDYRLEEAESHAGVPKEAMMIARLMGLDDKIIEVAERALEERKKKMKE